MLSIGSIKKEASRIRCYYVKRTQILSACATPSSHHQRVEIRRARSRNIHSLFRPNFDALDTFSYALDGDTFDVSSGNRTRLADMNTPERGEYGSAEATRFLEKWIYGTVYLDIDDIYYWDTTGTMIVCVVYVEYEPGRYCARKK